MGTESAGPKGERILLAEKGEESAGTEGRGVRWQGRERRVRWHTGREDSAGREWRADSLGREGRIICWHKDTQTLLEEKGA